MIPIKKGIESTGQPAVSIESGESSIPRKPILVEGGPAPEPITVTALNVTENGSYNAGENAAYNPVNVNVPVPAPNLEDITITENGTYEASEGFDGIGTATVNVAAVLPSEYLESEFDLLHSNSTDGFLDSIKGHKLNTSSYRGFRNGYITDRDCVVQMNVANEGDIRRVIVKTGVFDRSVEPNEEWLNLMRLNDNDWHFNLCYNNDDDYWRVSDESGSTVDIPGSTLPKYSFENTTFEIVFGAKYIDGVLYRGIKQNDVIVADYSERMFVYLNNTLVISNDRSVSPVFRVGGGNGWIGAKIENVKLYDVLNVYNRYYESEVQ